VPGQLSGMDARGALTRGQFSQFNGHFLTGIPRTKMTGLSSKALSRKSGQKSRLTRRLTAFTGFGGFLAIFIAVFAYLLLTAL
jgi:hypothetical protein